MGLGLRFAVRLGVEEPRAERGEEGLCPLPPHAAPAPCRGRSPPQPCGDPHSPGGTTVGSWGGLPSSLASTGREGFLSSITEDEGCWGPAMAWAATGGRKRCGLTRGAVCTAGLLACCPIRVLTESEGHSAGTAGPVGHRNARCDNGPRCDSVPRPRGAPAALSSAQGCSVPQPALRNGFLIVIILLNH